MYSVIVSDATLHTLPLFFCNLCRMAASLFMTPSTATPWRSFQPTTMGPASKLTLGRHVHVLLGIMMCMAFSDYMFNSNFVT